jgi:hypothetical protein
LSEKQHTAEFESCIADVMKQGKDKGTAFAICTKAFQDAGKPLFVGESESQKLHLFSESVKLDGNKVSGVAIHPKRIFHPEEGLYHEYFREELEKAAPSAAGKPFGIDHRYVLPPPNLMTKGAYDAVEDGIAFEGVVDDDIAERIRGREFKGISIEIDWMKPGGRVECVSGGDGAAPTIAARNFEVTSLHLLRQFPPGDKDAFIRLWNAIMEQPTLEGLGKQVEGLSSQLSTVNSKLDAMANRLVIKEEAKPVLPEQQKSEPEKNAAVEASKAAESEATVALRKKLVEAEAALADSQKQFREFKQKAEAKYSKLWREFRGTIPEPWIYRGWSGGPNQMVEVQFHVLRENATFVE